MDLRNQNLKNYIGEYLCFPQLAKSSNETGAISDFVKIIVNDDILKYALRSGLNLDFMH